MKPSVWRRLLAPSDTAPAREDGGGPGGLDELVRALGDKAHPEHEMYREWIESIGQVDYDPARCELDEINKVLASHPASAPRP